MSLCPICGRVYCDHTAEERGQTFGEMMSGLTKEEIAAFNKRDSSEKIAVARRVRDEQHRKRNIKK